MIRTVKKSGDDDKDVAYQKAKKMSYGTLLKTALQRAW